MRSASALEDQALGADTTVVVTSAGQPRTEHGRPAARGGRGQPRDRHDAEPGRPRGAGHLGHRELQLVRRVAGRVHRHRTRRPVRPRGRGRRRGVLRDHGRLLPGRGRLRHRVRRRRGRPARRRRHPGATTRCCAPTTPRSRCACSGSAPASSGTSRAWATSSVTTASDCARCCRPGCCLALWLLGIAMLAVIWWRGRRLGALASEPLPVTVRSLETTEARGRLYRSTSAPRCTLPTCCAERRAATWPPTCGCRRARSRCSCATSRAGWTDPPPTSTP